MIFHRILLFLGFIPPLCLPPLIWKFHLPIGPTRRVLRSPTVNRSIFAVAAVTFLHKITTLGAADFGEHRTLLLILFGTLALLVLVHNPDFLAVRGLAILQFLWANELLKTGQGHFSTPWLTAKLFAYASILLALTLTVRPYLLRDWLTGKSPQ
jgi:hypothetical protein